MGFLLGEREQFLLVSLTVSKKKKKKLVWLVSLGQASHRNLSRCILKTGVL